MNWENVLLTTILFLAIGDAIGLLLWARRIDRGFRAQTAAIGTLTQSVMLLAQRLGDVEGRVGNTTYYMTYGRTAYKLVADVPGHIGERGNIICHRPLASKNSQELGKKVRITAWLDDGEDFLNGT